MEFFVWSNVPGNNVKHIENGNHDDDDQKMLFSYYYILL